WLNHGERKWGEMYVQAVNATGFEPNYLAIIKYVGESVEPSRRREALSFSHHRLVAPLQPAEQETFLAHAEKNKWTRNQLADAVKAFRHELEYHDAGQEINELPDDDDCDGALDSQAETETSKPKMTTAELTMIAQSVSDSMGKILVELRRRLKSRT